jgi:hypothetical protein
MTNKKNNVVFAEIAEFPSYLLHSLVIDSIMFSSMSGLDEKPIYLRS